MSASSSSSQDSDASSVESSETASVVCDTTQGEIELLLHRAWSPHGYDKAVELFAKGYYDQSHFFRVVKNFLVQFGIGYTTDPALRQLARKTIPDDPQLEPRIPFEPGTISYAGSGPNSRNAQLFIAYRGAESFGRELWETPIGKVVRGMDHVRNFYSYGDIPPYGKGPVQQRIHEGREYIDESFPKLDSFLKCTVTKKLVGTEPDEPTSASSSKEANAAAEESRRELRGHHDHTALHHFAAAEPSALTIGHGGELTPLTVGLIGSILAFVILFLRHQGKKHSSKAL